MMRWVRRLIYATLFVGGVLIAAMTALSAASQRVPQLGVHNGRLADCPDSPNCVCSNAVDAEHAVAPLTIAGDPQAAFDRAVEQALAQPRSRLIRRDDDYAHIELASPVFRFKDDLELLLDRSAGVIHIRAAARVGRSDLGVNRARVETLRRALAAQP